jgi:aryl-alcohol dehydrogenase-like predicted oxidoreductase
LELEIMHYKIFGRHTGLRVSELALGAGNFGTRWGHGAGRSEAKKVFDAYAEAGGKPELLESLKVAII